MAVGLLLMFTSQEIDKSRKTKKSFDFPASTQKKPSHPQFIFLQIYTKQDHRDTEACTWVEHSDAMF